MRPVPTHAQRDALARVVSTFGLPAELHVQLTRKDYAALRRELKAVKQWLGAHRRAFRTDPDDRWDRHYYRRMAIEKMLPVPRDPLGFAVMAQNHAIRRSHVLHRIKQRRLDAQAKALDTTGMTPLQAAMARLAISFGGSEA